MGRFRAAALVLALVAGWSEAGHATGETPELTNHDWSFDGIFGTFDRAEAQRGLQVYQQVCSTCHALNLVDFRHLTALGFNENEVAAIASEYTVIDGPDDNGEMFERPALASDGFPDPFPNEQAARAANGGAYPPDLSLIAKAREGGADYIYSLLTGYTDPPPDVELRPGTYWNEYYPGHQIAMPPILQDGGVQFTDGTEPTVENQGRAVTQFLTFMAEPNMEARKETGVKVVLFLILFAGMMYAVKRKVWADLH